MAALLLLVLVAGAVIYVAFPSYTVEVTRELAATPDEAFAAFMDHEHWHEYFEFDELFPPEGEVDVGTRFAYNGSEGDRIWRCSSLSLVSASVSICRATRSTQCSR
jgi:hypothetical protein